MKKGILWLCVALLLAASAFPAHAIAPTQTEPTEQAEESTEQEEELIVDQSIIEEAHRVYRQCQQRAGRTSFHGYCGLMTSYQLWVMGINTTLDSRDGNKQYDAYKDKKVSTGGHDIQAFSAKEYDLLETLKVISRNGTQDVRNILIGFQWTNTQAGARFGHACIINAIKDGVVYFTESFDSAFGYREGQTITCSIEAFAEYFNKWTVYEGAIYFGTKKYANYCNAYGTDLYVQLRFDSTLRSQPCLIGRNESQRLRELSAGELLHAVAVYANDEGDLFYKIDDGGVIGYVSANAVYTVQVNENITVKDAKVPQYIDRKRDLHFSGTVDGGDAHIEQIYMKVTDDSGKEVMQTQMQIQGQTGQLKDMDELISLHTLPAGQYWVSFSADVSYHMVENGTMTAHREEKQLLRQSLGIGEQPQEVAEEDGKTEKNITDGWFIKDGIWYCYEFGFPRQGWATRVGVLYLLKEDGSVTTGWIQDEDGKLRYFSGSGALCQGWTTTPSGTYYFKRDGEIATGMQQIDGKQYWFEQTGILAVGGTCTWEEATYQIHADGTVSLAE